MQDFFPHHNRRRSAPLPARARRDLRTDLSALDRIEKGMARRAVSYVLTGMGSSILFELGDRAVDLLTLAYVAGDPTTRQRTLARRRVLLTPKKWHPEAIRRYCEIIAIALKANKQMWDYVPGSDAAPDWIRVFTLIAAKSAEDKAGEGPKLPSDFILRLCALLSAQSLPPATIVDLIFARYNHHAWSYRAKSLLNLPYLNAVVEQLGMEAIDTIRPLDVASRAHFITYLVKRGLLHKEVFQDYILASSNDPSAELRKAAIKALESTPAKTIRIATKIAATSARRPTRDYQRSPLRSALS